MSIKHLLVGVIAMTACGGGEAKPSAATAHASASVSEAQPSPPATLLTPDPAALAAKAPAKFSVVLVTSKGEIEIAVERALAPIDVDRLYYLASNGFYNQSKFFRVIYGFAAQFGLSGIPAVDQVFDTLSLKDDPPKLSNTKGTVAFAKRNAHSRSTQLFISLKDNASDLDPQNFAPVGRVVRGMEAAERLMATYGDMPNKPGMLLTRGNEYLRVRYPELDSIMSVTIKK